jgi:hypothetical protein
MEMAAESDGGRWCGGADEVVVVVVVGGGGGCCVRKCEVGGQLGLKTTKTSVAARFWVRCEIDLLFLQQSTTG